jgi:lysozyme family protein
MTKTIDQLVDEVIGKEGGYSNHPADKGGPTRWGITEQVARAYGYKGDMQALPRVTAVAIYKRRYWIDVRFDQVAAVFPRVAAEMFDTGINMGQSIAAGFLQRAINLLNLGATLYPDITADGQIGAMTIAALRSYQQKRGAAGEVVLLKTIDGFQTGRYADITEARPANEAFFYGWIANRIGVEA